MRTGIRTLIMATLALFFVAASPATAASANVNDFDYASWTSEYELSLDAEGRSQVTVTETLVARFPDFDQNRGIVRGIATRFEDANLHTRVVSITDENGNRVPYETDKRDDTLYLSLGDDDFQHGLTTYVITYTMQDAMISADGTRSGHDEFYWNFLPLNSTQAVEQFTGIVTLSPELADAFAGDITCYRGYYGQNDLCEISQEPLADGGMRVTATGHDLPARYGITIAIGFTPGTVTQPAARVPNPTLEAAPIALGAAGLASAIGSGFAVRAFRRRARTATGIVVAQYDVPDDLPPLMAATVYPGSRNAIPAEIVHLAVKGALRIEDISVGKKIQPQLRRLDDRRASDPIDLDMQTTLFGTTAPGEAMTLPKNSEYFARRMTAAQRRVKTAASERGLLEKRRSPATRILLWLTLALTAAVLVVGAIGFVQDRQTVIARFTVGITFAIVALAFAALNAKKHDVHTRRGAEVYEYLGGVREFIRVAEADRLRMLQSAEGAERYREGGEEVVHLYERLLPYAMLFGEEKSWGKVLEVAYSASDVQPVWFHGYTTMNFSSQLSAFSSSTQSSANYSSSSSSSGGSSGGGFSGGGGGGGFSGGR